MATRQHGVVAASQLRALGFSGGAIRVGGERHRLHRLHRGVYAVGHRALTRQGHCLAAVLACEPAVASHASAAWLWGLYRQHSGRFHITASSRRHARVDIRVHFASLRESDRDVVDGIPLTSVPRTMLDLAARVSGASMGRIVDRAEELKLLDLAAVDELLGRAGGHNGVARLRRACDLYRPSPFTRSGLERRFLELVREAALPRPSSNYFVAGYELDAYWEAERFGVELDTYETHGRPAAFERDRIRDESLTLAGIETIRITGSRLDREPREVIDRLRDHLARRRAIQQRVRP